MSDSRYVSGELIGVNKGRIKVIDSLGNIFTTFETDLRYINGEFKRYKKHD